MIEFFDLKIWIVVHFQITLLGSLSLDLNIPLTIVVSFFFFGFLGFRDLSSLSFALGNLKSWFEGLVWRNYINRRIIYSANSIFIGSILYIYRGMVVGFRAQCR